MIKTIAVGLALIIAAGCSQQTEPTQATAERSLTIYTTIAPIHFVVRTLLGDKDTIINTTPADEDAANYIPERQVLMAMANADLIVLNGAGFEEWIEAVSLPDSIIFDSALGFRDEWIEYEGIVHSHGGHDDHSHEGYNGHTWLSPYYFQQQVTAIYERLKTLLTTEEQQARNLSENYQALSASIAVLHEKAQTVFAPLAETTVAATHPTYDYVARAYGFDIFNIDIDPDAEDLTGHVQRELDKLKHQQEQTPISFLLWEEEPGEILVEAVSGLNLTNIVFPPLDDIDDPDYITGMKETFTQIEQIISSAQP